MARSISCLHKQTCRSVPAVAINTPKPKRRLQHVATSTTPASLFREERPGRVPGGCTGDGEAAPAGSGGVAPHRRGRRGPQPLKKGVLKHTLGVPFVFEVTICWAVLKANSRQTTHFTIFPTHTNNGGLANSPMSSWGSKQSDRAPVKHFYQLSWGIPLLSRYAAFGCSFGDLYRLKQTPFWDFQFSCGSGLGQFGGCYLTESRRCQPAFLRRFLWDHLTQEALIQSYPTGGKPKESPWKLPPFQAVWICGLGFEAQFLLKPKWHQTKPPRKGKGELYIPCLPCCQSSCQSHWPDIEQTGWHLAK